LHGARADAFSDRQAQPEVGGVHTSRQPVLGVVGDGYRVIEVAVALNRDDRTEDLLLRDRVAVVVDKQDGRLDVVAPLEVGGPSATGDQLPPGGDAGRGEALDAVTLRG